MVGEEGRKDNEMTNGECRNDGMTNRKQGNYSSGGSCSTEAAWMPAAISGRIPIWM